MLNYLQSINSTLWTYMMLLTMTDIEIYKINTIKNVIDKRISGVDAAALLNLSPRQVYRLTKQYLKHGAEGLISHKRGQPSNHHHSYKFKQHVLDLVQIHYQDFGPTLAHEKLTELHAISVGVETLRQWMITDGLWLPHAKRKPQVYQPRYRRDCVGELIQIDGSHHGLANF
ncbi:helix-turn-helix domain-containing protein [Moritella yayanosii]